MQKSEGLYVSPTRRSAAEVFQNFIQHCKFFIDVVEEALLEAVR